MKERPGARTVSQVALVLSLLGVGEILVAVLAGSVILPLLFWEEARSGRVLSVPQATPLFLWPVAGTVVGLFTLRAARANSRYRGRRQGLVAMVLGSLFCPVAFLGVPIMVYGLLSYRRPDVRSVFELGEGGATQWQVENVPSD
jgi:hypothetical protein